MHGLRRPLFVGVVVACRPTHLHQPLPILLALTAAVLWAYTSILIRQVVATASTPPSFTCTSGAGRSSAFASRACG